MADMKAWIDGEWDRQGSKDEGADEDVIALLHWLHGDEWKSRALLSLLSQAWQMGRDEALGEAAKWARAQARECELADKREPEEGHYEARIACLNVASAIEALEVTTPPRSAPLPPSRSS